MPAQGFGGAMKAFREWPRNNSSRRGRTARCALAWCCGALVTALALAVPVMADEDAGTSSPFALGAGCRTIAMGRAAAAVWGGSYALLWNPAGLYQVERNEVSAFHTSLFDDASTYSSILATHPFLDIGVISFGALQLGVGGIERRDAENRVVGGDIKNTQTRYVLGYARNVFRGITGGVNLKLDRFVLDSYRANGLGIDAGAGFMTNVSSPAIDGVAFGLSIVNLVEPKINLVNEEAGDPRGVRVGFSVWRSISDRLGDRLLVAFDFDKNRYSEMHTHVGVEYRAYDHFAVRGGWDAGIPTFGCGFELRSFLFDYAYRSTDLGGNHLFSLAFQFGASRSERREERRSQREMEIRRELDAQMDRLEGQFVTDALDSGEKILEEGKFEEATEQFRRVLLWSPENERARRGMEMANTSLLVVKGDSLTREGRLAEALFSYRKAWKYQSTHEIEQKIDRCERQIEHAADRNEMIDRILTHSIELFTERDWNGAARGFEQILELDPEHTLARSYLQKTGERIDEEHDRVITRADRLVAGARYGEALLTLRAGLETFPADSVLIEKIEHVAALQRSARSARRERGERDTGTTEISSDELEELGRRYEKGVEAFKRNNFVAAIEHWEVVWKRHARFEKVDEYLVRAYQYHGMNLYSRNQYRKALEVWGKILEVDRNNEKALRYMQRTRQELERLEGLIN